MTSSNIDTVVEALVRARRDHAPADVPALSSVLTDPAEAYAIQQRVAQELGWFERGTPRYWKAGGPNLQSLTYAPLPPNGVWPSPAQSGGWYFDRRAVEVEIALRLGSDVNAATAATLDLDRARGLIDAMTVSIEMVDSRWSEGFQSPALLRLADLQSHGCLVLGDWRPYESTRDWRKQLCRTQVGEEDVVERTGAHSLGDPAAVLPGWLRHATRDGATLAAGTVVTTGTWVGVLQAAKGDLVEAVFPGIGEATLQL